MPRLITTTPAKRPFGPSNRRLTVMTQSPVERLWMGGPMKGSGDGLPRWCAKNALSRPLTCAGTLPVDVISQRPESS